MPALVSDSGAVVATLGDRKMSPSTCSQTPERLSQIDLRVASNAHRHRVDLVELVSPQVESSVV